MNIRELREQLTDESIKDILGQFNVQPFDENENEIIFPTCDHNLEGGSPKLFYYKNTKLFVSYSDGENTPFDIFGLLQKMMALRDRPITLKQAIEMCDLDTSGDFNSLVEKDWSKSSIEDLQYLQRLNNTYIPTAEDLQFRIYDKDVLRQFSFDYIGLMPWIQEGIGIEALQRFNIKYNVANQSIVIPNFDKEGNLIGIRARYFREEDIVKGKYRPLFWNKQLYNHPTGRSFYGIFENHKNIERKGTVIIYEGEKSVLKHETIYGKDQNIAVATLGQNITKDHIQYLLNMGVRHVILAYDTDYEDYTQLYEKERLYTEKGRILAPYFNVSILMDYDFLLPYKSSPIDGGKEIFEKILKDRRIVK